MVESKEKEIVEMKVSYCSNCKKYGFNSIYPTKEGKLQCTDCATKMNDEKMKHGQ